MANDGWAGRMIQNMQARTAYEIPTRWDATMLRTYQECPRKFELGILQGWTLPESAVDLQYGAWVHLGLERFYKAIMQGYSHDEAVRFAVSGILEQSWDYVEDKPLLGEYAPVWRCLGKTKYRNEKGNPAKCPYSHKGVLIPGHGPGTCGECGSPTEDKRVWAPVDKVKNRVTAVRTVVWFTEEFKDWQLRIVSLGTSPLIEHHWQTPITPKIVACGTVDAVFQLGDSDTILVADYKTTRQSLGKNYFDQFDPHTQVEFYNMFRDAISAGLGFKVEGVAIIAMSLTQGGVKFGVNIFRQSEQRMEEAKVEFAYNLAMVDWNNKVHFWPRNTAHCFRCPFRPVCSAEPSARETILRENYIQAKWNPMTRRREPVDAAECRSDDSSPL